MSDGRRYRRLRGPADTELSFLICIVLLIIDA